jgi:metal-sulfur cluster biosynthetic enzyme
MNDVFDEQIRAALERVCDPCSIAVNAPISILDMGLVRGWSVDEQCRLTVRMCVTSPSCTMSPHMVKAAEQLLAAIPGLDSVRVEVDPEIFWTSDDMTERGRQILQFRRGASLNRTAVVPQQWRNRPPV